MSILSLALATAFASSPCPAAAPPDTRCLSDGQHLLLLGAHEAPEPILTDLEDAQRLFQAHFGRAAPPTAIATVAVTAPLSSALGDAGYSATLPWISEAQLLAQFRQQIGTRLDEATIRTLAAQQAERMRQTKPMTHELGHVWLIATYWPDAGRAVAPPDGELRYAGPGPDWLDELAAVASEGPQLIASRRASFARMVESGRLPPLDAWLLMAHPLIRTLSANRQLLSANPAQGGASITVLSGDEAKALLAKAAATTSGDPGSPITPTDFYDMARGVVDFLDARASAPPYHAIAAHVAGGGTLGSWLETKGERYGLPTTMTAFASAFRTWAEQTTTRGPG